MAIQHDPAPSQGMLRRPRLQSLIGEGLKQPLLVMLAGPGYGKTQAMADYLKHSGAEALWLHLGALDNLPGHFWDHFTEVLKNRYPALGERLAGLTFPETISSFELFASLLARHVCKKGRVIWVFDNYGEITDPRIKGFVKLLVDADLEDLHLVLLSNVLTNSESVAFMTNKRALIMAKDLRFTPDEIAGLYALRGISLTSDELGGIERHTEGWPLPLYLLVQQGNTQPNALFLDNRAVAHLFEERFFSNLSKQRQTLLVKLAQLNSFTKELALSLYEGDPADFDELENHAFVSSEPATGRLFFHRLYRLFLQNKQHHLTSEEERRFWQTSAEYYDACGATAEAIACYRKSGDHIGMLGAIVNTAIYEYGLTNTNAAYYLEHLDLLTPQEQKAHPAADCIRALIYMSTLRLEEAQRLLLDLEKRLLAANTPDQLAFLGDVYVMQGLIRMQQVGEDFGDYFKKAADYSSGRSGYNNSDTLRIQNSSSFFIADNGPGAKERMERAMHYGIPWLAKTMRGALGGDEHMFSAESAYLSFELEPAQQHAYRAIYAAEKNAQHDLVCNGYFLLARIGLMKGDFPEMAAQIQNLTDYAAKHELAILNEIRDTALAWYYVRLRDLSRVPKNIFARIDSEMPMFTTIRSQIIYANYLIAAKEYARLIGMLETLRKSDQIIAVAPDSIALYILLAIAYDQFEDPGAALGALWIAYAMTHNNNLTALFIEAGDYMSALVEKARRQDRYRFSSEWLDWIGEKAKDQSRLTKAARAAYRKQNPVRKAQNNPLSKREADILQALSQGLTREEIALANYISINTVKSTIRNIYNKLDANNRADAVSIALAHGYIEGYAPADLIS